MNYSDNRFGGGFSGGDVAGENRFAGGSPVGMNNRGSADTMVIPSFSDLMHTIAIPANPDTSTTFNSSNSINSSPMLHAHSTQTPVIQAQNYMAPRVQYMLPPLSGGYANNGTRCVQQQQQQQNNNNNNNNNNNRVGMVVCSSISISGSVSSSSSSSSSDSSSSSSGVGGGGVQLPSLQTLVTDVERDCLERECFQRHTSLDHASEHRTSLGHISPGHSPKSRKTKVTPKKSNKTKVTNKTRRYVCEVCTKESGEVKAFTTSGHLARHKRIHSGEKNFACTFPGCEQRFSRRDNRNQHYKTHEKKNT
ncbi:hypothetical protein ACO0QE_000786 [Hanseniaspora vineae]